MSPVEHHRASELLKQAAGIVAGDREAQHGPKERNHENIAILWRAYMALKYANEGAAGLHGITAFDVATMMELLKIARRFAGAGRTNPDNYVDGAGYCGVAGEIALNGREVPAEANSAEVFWQALEGGSFLSRPS